MMDGINALPLVLGFIGALGPAELIIVGIIAVLLFGKRLPSVARSLGQSFIEFKKGMHGMEDEVRSATSTSYSSHDESGSIDEHEQATAPKFEPPTAEPKKEEAATQANMDEKVGSGD